MDRRVIVPHHNEIRFEEMRIGPGVAVESSDAVTFS